MNEGGPGLAPLDDDAREAAGMLETIVVARRAWKRKVTERLNQLSSRAGIPLAYSERRGAAEDDAFGFGSDSHQHATGGGSTKGATRAGAAAATASAGAGDQAPVFGSALTESIAASLSRMEFTETLRTDIGHLYSDVDLLEAVVSIQRGPPHVGGAIVPSWGLVRVELRPPSAAWLRGFFAKLSPEHRQVGLDDNIFPWFADKRRQEGAALARARSIPQCRSYARTGVPTALRPELWAAALGVQQRSPSAAAAAADGSAGGGGGGGGAAPDFRSRSRSIFERLCVEVKRRELMIDGLCVGDAREICDHAHYFPFEETMRAVMLAFTRDAAVPAMCATTGRCAPHPRLDGVGRGGRSFGPYPPCGVLPFRGLGSYVAPLCYLYPHPADVYPVFRELYVRHFCRLHVVSDETSPSPALPALCRAFEDMLQSADPEVCFHLLQLGVPALRVAAPWMIRAFVRDLEVEQVLLLWDRVIGFDSVLPLAVAAAGVITFRRDALLAASSAAKVAEAVEDLTQIQVIPLMQAFLFFNDGLSAAGAASASGGGGKRGGVQ